MGNERGTLSGPRKPVSRRWLLLGGAGSVAATAVGCDALSTDPNGESSETRDGPAGSEAPQLAQQVEAGELPPLEERLPTEAIVIEPIDGVSAYGGTWRDLMLNRDGTNMYRSLAYDMLVRWDVEWQEIVPNIAESWDADEEGREYVFHLREGIKWSDGEPFTADDIAFAYEGVITDPELTPSSTQEFDIDGEYAEFEQIDQYTVKWTFPGPNGLFLDRMASPGFATSRLVLPRHYFEQFHPAYSDEAEQRAQDEGFDDWRQFFEARGGGGTIATDYWANAEIPTIFPWRVANPLNETRMELERNPYYWKVDPEGRQLPYLDGVNLEIVEDAEALLLKASNGEVDFNANPSDFCTLSNKPVLAEGRAKGDYDFVDVTDSRSNYIVLQPNLNHDDEGLRELFGNKDFRIGLSHAINRQEIINTSFQRQGEPWQVAPRPESDFYDEEFATQYVEYDVDLANTHLDQAGLTERNSDGIRLRPDGSPVAFSILLTPDAPETVSALELVEEYFLQVGVDLTLSTVSGDLKVTRQRANEYDMMADVAFYGMRDGILYPNWYFPHRPDTAFAPKWGEWYETGGEGGEEPPDGPRQQMELYDEIKRSPSLDERAELFREILQIAKEEFAIIGIALPTGTYGILKNAFHNVPDPLIYGWVYPLPGPTGPEQFVIQT